MNNTIIFILSFIDMLSETIELVYELGAFTRKYIVPAIVSAYVVAEMAWEQLTSMEWSVEYCNKPLTKGFA